jgi:hypothetical protein
MIVHAQPGYALDWDWSTELTVWQTAHDRAGRLITTHRLDRRPANEHEAEIAARRWWRHEGSTMTRADERQHASEESP